MSETALKRAIVTALTRAGAWVWRMQAGKVKVRGGWMELAPEGMPDLLGVIPPTGRLFGLEVKKPKGSRFEPAQLATHERLNAAGAYVAVVRSVDEAVAEYRAALAEEGAKQ